MLPRMRTARGAIEEIKQMDPNTEITESAIRRAMKRGDLRTVPNGRKHLVSLDEVLRYFGGEDAEERPKPQQYSGEKVIRIIGLEAAQ